MADRFALLLDLLCKAMAARMAKNEAARPVLLLLYDRLRRLMGRFAAVWRRWRGVRMPVLLRPKKSRPDRHGPTHAFIVSI
jgi:hypothetical protein